MKLLETIEHEIKNDLESFKMLWRKITKQSKGDIVNWGDQEFQVENVKDSDDDDQKIYTICRIDPVAGMKLKILCHKILAKPNELKTK